MNTFMYIDKRLIDLGQEQKAKLVHASNDEEKALVNAFYTGAKNELASLRDELMSDVSPDDELPANHIVNHAEMR
ncbi:hypothetical protein WE348_20395 (plasmid) [Alteromonas macleodii]|uniref:hypothetical protein n=1 Tax=Alteromonas macleodii TaxID=28108 RepID=UPI0030CDBCA5